MNGDKLPVTVTINPNVITQDVEDEAVLLHMGTEEYFSLDDVGTVMWKLLNDLPLVEDVISALMTMYDVDESRLRQDLANLLEKLVHQKLIATHYT